jgi:hypothetical protein
MTDGIELPRPATVQLLALAAVARPDWSADQLRDVLAQARLQGMTFGRVLVGIAQLIADPEARPEAWRQRRRPAAPETAQRGAAAARAALHRPDTD